VSDGSLTTRSAKAVGWGALGLVLTEPIRILATALIARMLGPQEFGLFAMTGVFVGLIGIVNSGGLGVVVIRDESGDRGFLSTLFWLNLALGLVCTIAGWMIADPVAALYGQPVVAPLLRAMSLTFLLSSFSQVQNALLRKKLRLRAIALSNVAAVVVQSGVSIGLAMSGAGAWALVGGALAAPVAQGIVLQIISGFVPRFMVRTNMVRDALRLGGALTVADLAGYGSTSVDNLLVGKALGSSALGQYSVAYNLAVYPVRQISVLISGVTLPVFSSISGDPNRFRAALSRSIAMACALSFPVLSAASASGSSLVVGLYGEKWLGAVLPFQILCVAGAARAVSSMFDSSLRAAGRSRSVLLVSVLGLAFVLGFCLPALGWGMTAVAAAVSLATVCSALTTIVAAAREFDMTYGGVARCLAPGLALAVLAGVASFLVAGLLGAMGVWPLVTAVCSVAVGVALPWIGLRNVPFMRALREVEDLALRLVPRGGASREG
jgi:O-antigen/teichoic acid export membrane protein